LCQEKIQTLKSDSEVQNFINGLKVIEKSTEYQDHLKELIFTQYNIKQGMKEYPEEGKSSIMKELNNLVKRDVFGEVEYESLSPQQRKWALPILLFMVMKRNVHLSLKHVLMGDNSGYGQIKKMYHCQHHALKH
jgi:hypothetical protein